MNSGRISWLWILIQIKSSNFPPSCPDYPWWIYERELLYSPKFECVSRKSISAPESFCMIHIVSDIPANALDCLCVQLWSLVLANKALFFKEKDFNCQPGPGYANLGVKITHGSVRNFNTDSLFRKPKSKFFLSTVSEKIIWQNAFEPELYSSNWPSAGLPIFCVVFAETNAKRQTTWNA